MNKKILFGFLLIIAVLVFSYTFYYLQNTDDNILIDDTTDNSTLTEQPGLMEFKDTGLVSYYVEFINEECPIGKPDWASYRGCIFDLLESEKVSFKGDAQTIKAYGDYCAFGASLSSDDYSNGYAELYNICMLYKITKANDELLVEQDGGDNNTLTSTQQSLLELEKRLNNQEIKIEQVSSDIKMIRCDLSPAFSAERGYTYPFLLELGYVPEKYGVGINNPITSKTDYNCNL